MYLYNSSKRCVRGWNRAKSRGHYYAISFVIVVFCLVAFVNQSLAESVSYTEGIDTLSISYDKCVAGEEYALMLLEGENVDSISVDGLLFVDQLVANSEGKIYVAFVNPSFPTCSVLLGGYFKNGQVSPQNLGVFKPPVDEEPIYRFTLPEMLITIDDEAFSECAFTHVYLGENVETIGSQAFANSRNMVYIFIPNSTIEISDDAFDGCNNLVIGCYEGSAAKQFAINHNISYKIIR